MNPFATRPEAAESLDIWGSLYRFKALGGQTGNAYTLVEVQGESGFETPLHSHANEEEGFYVIDGAVTLVLGDDLLKVPPGTFGFAPRGLAHGFRFESSARMLLLLTPGGAGHEGMFREMGAPTDANAAPSKPSLPSDPEGVARTAARHGTQVLGPLP